MNKFLYAVGLFGTVSNLAASADVVASDAPQGPLSPVGYHGGKHGEMCETIVTVRGVEEKGRTTRETRNFPVNGETTVVDLRAAIITAFRIPAAHRLMWGDVEVMKRNVNSEGDLITLASEFSGVAGVPVIDIIADPGRSPMLSPVPVSGDVSPLKVEEAD